MKIFIVGSLNMDLVIKAPFMPENGVTITGSDFMTNSGGKGANQAAAVAKLGGNAMMVGCVGNSFGDDLIKNLKRYGVNTQYVVKKDNVSSGVAIIVIVDSDNRIILDAGANAIADEALVDKALADANEGDYLICQLEIPQKTVAYALKQAKEKGLVTVLNPAPAAKLIDGVLSYCDYFISNQSETEFYTGIYPTDEASVRKAAEKLGETGVKNVVITMGEQGSAALVNGEFVQVKRYKVKAVDTTSAGDTYVGALIIMLSQGKNIKEAMDFASKASALAVTKNGAQQSIPYLQEVWNFKECID